MRQEQTPIWHENFKLNGLSFDSLDSLNEFLDSMKTQGNEFELDLAEFLTQWLSPEPNIVTYTSGTTGQPKICILSKENMRLSARNTGAFFEVQSKAHALLCLPLSFIAGKMMVVRALVLGWDLHLVPPTKDALTQYDTHYDFVALVPHQLAHSYRALNKVKTLIVGGGVLPRYLEDKLQDSSVQAYATYGMTETLTHVAARRLNGPERSDRYRAMPGVEFNIDHRGCLVITAPNLLDTPLVTNDLVDLIDQHTFIYSGRIDDVINCGGVKYSPESLERKLRNHLNDNFVISSLPHETLGEQIVLVKDSSGPSDTLINESFAALSPLERPKLILNLEALPQTNSGKYKRKEIRALIRNQKNQG
jgi:O-succinylbenzoic acid--CoA ligase